MCGAGIRQNVDGADRFLDEIKFAQKTTAFEAKEASEPCFSVF